MAEISHTLIPPPNPAPLPRLCVQLYPVTGYKWSETANSVLQDNNEPDKPGTEKNIMMSYKFPDY